MRRMLYFIELINFSVKVFAATKGGVISFYGYTPIEESCIYYINTNALSNHRVSRIVLS